MNNYSEQMEEWAGDFGKEYTDRNAHSISEMELLCKQHYGITRSEINSRFIGGFDRNMKILEVGSNIGNQLLLLQNMGFKNLYGVDLQYYAVELSKSRTKNINIIQGSAFDIPFKDGFFDMVFTSGLLIHISPEDINLVLDEIYRCTNKYIWGLEYYAETYTNVNYRGYDNLLWKTDYSKLFVDHFGNLSLVKKELLKYSENDNIDTVYLLEKK
jgi:pseudaminic acid biosynthesis-associated methylase